MLWPNIRGGRHIVYGLGEKHDPLLPEPDEVGCARKSAVLGFALGQSRNAQVLGFDLGLRDGPVWGLTNWRGGETPADAPDGGSRSPGSVVAPSGRSSIIQPSAISTRVRGDVRRAFAHPFAHPFASDGVLAGLLHKGNGVAAARSRGNTTGQKAN